MNLFRNLSCVFVLGGLVSCASLPEPQTLIFDYEDFGPQAMAQELLGHSWWQWQKEESISDSDDVQVIVYEGIPLSLLKKRYPADPQKNRDYRYVKYDDAVSYLDEKIEENVIPSLTSQLSNIRVELVAVFE